MLFSLLPKSLEKSVVVLFKLQYTTDQPLGPMLNTRPLGDIRFELTELSDYRGV